MIIEYEERSNKFIIRTEQYSEGSIVAGMPERRYRKASRTWAAPALKRNVRYMDAHMNNPQIYSAEALEVFNRVRGSLNGGSLDESEFPADFKFKNPPMEHQMKALNKAYPLDSFALLFEQGLGKTYTTINLITAWYQAGLVDSAVIVCPSSIKLVWEKEIDKHCPIDTTRHVLASGQYKKADEFIKNKDGFQWFILGVEALSQGKAHEYMEKFFYGRKVAMAIDESSRIKNRTATRTTKCFTAGGMAKKKLILSGTSITQGVEDWYAQFFFLDKEILGYNSYYPFRDHFCVTMSMEVAPNRFQTKIIGYKNQEELMKLVGPYAMRVEKEDALDLPDKVFMNRYIEMGREQKKIYKTMEEELLSVVEGGVYEVTTILEQMMRLQQITGGFQPYDNSENVQPVPIKGRNAKVDEVVSLLEEIEGKVIIWCQFNAEIDAVAEALDKEKVSYVKFTGQSEDSEKSEAVESFQEGNTKVFLASRAAAYGLTLTAASYAIYYSLGYSYEMYAQSQDRIHRIGQKDKCTYIHLVCQGTVDEKVLSALEIKRDTAAQVYQSLKNQDGAEVKVKDEVDNLLDVFVNQS